MLHLTKMTMKLGRGARKGTLLKAWEKNEITQKWENSTWAKKLAAAEKV